MLPLPFVSVLKKHVGLPFCKNFPNLLLGPLYFLCFGQVGNLRFFQGLRNTGSLDLALSVFPLLSLCPLPADGPCEFPVSAAHSFPREPEAGESNCVVSLVTCQWEEWKASVREK